MSFMRRQQLVRLAREYDALIIADDVYDQIQWPSSTSSSPPSPSASPPPDLRKAQVPRLVDIDRTLDGGTVSDFGNAASNGSFSKILGPGVRTGWVEGTAKFAYGVSQTGTSHSGGAPSHLTATFVASLLETGELQEHIFECLQPNYRRRYCKMLDAIRCHLVPLGAVLPEEDKVVGGYFVWVKLPVNAVVLAKKAKEVENLVVAEGAIFEVPGDREVANFPNEIRLCFAWEDEERLVEGIERLASVVKLMLEEKNDCDDSPANRPDVEEVQVEEESQTLY
jgi:DNA-binding transcriptional MocR family regulator